MNSLKSRLEKAMALPEKNAAWASSKSAHTKAYNAGRDDEHSRRQALDQALVALVGALKTSIIIEDTCEECGTFKEVRYEISEISLALAALSKELGE